MLIDYARVSSQGQSLDRQIGALNTVKVDKFFLEVAFGRIIKSRPQLERAIDALGAGDVLVIAEWRDLPRDRIGFGCGSYHYFMTKMTEPGLQQLTRRAETGPSRRPRDRSPQSPRPTFE
jgi:DNA invertase Pin-like site-specific DNA recombinase